MHLSGLEIGRFLAGELTPDERSAFAAHLRSCVECAALFSQAEQAAAGFAGGYPSFASLDASRQAPRRRREPKPTWGERLVGLFGGPGLLRPALASAVVLLAAAAMFWRLPSRPAGDFSAKGGASFSLFLNGRHVGVENLICGPADTLQLQVTAPSPVYYAILYRDDEGPLQVYLGGDGEAQRPLGLPKGENLPHSFILTGGWKRETLYCIWSRHPLTLPQAEAIAERAVEGAEPTAHGEDPGLQLYHLENRR